ncbi:LytR family transcriptional regulator [Neobacillus notoginsengisoli]|uniref:Regulatory protein MsrR n=1 Tax=Neobacillus notoginsengisoli TaxID=1578198 RepID=A0A417YZ45_9BACI|nr:LCP family protein [Neobacillus notoginsengisoli]RHW43157.1 LytR family transcriptional regulator [Neobacillus notoginsengisoli]
MRYEERRKRKTHKWKRVLAVAVLFIAALGGYTIYQYKQGVRQSEQLIGDQPKTEYTFNGNKDEYGGTNILLLGSDSRHGERARADTIMIAHYNQAKGTYKLTSIMRDSYVDIPGYGKHKINSAFAIGGPDLMRQAIKENFGLDLQYYAIVGFEGFVQLVDEAFPEGVEIEVEKPMRENIGVRLEPGLQRLDGAHLLGYVRFRHDAVGDFGRVKRQQKVVKKVANDITSFEKLPKLPKLIGIVVPFINTNMETNDMLFMAKDFIGKDRESIQSLRIPVNGSYTDRRISGEGAVLAIDIYKNRQALHHFITE